MSFTEAILSAMATAIKDLEAQPSDEDHIKHAGNILQVNMMTYDDIVIGIMGEMNGEVASACLERFDKLLDELEDYCATSKRYTAKLDPNHVVVVMPGESPRIERWSDFGLKAKQKAVGGLIELVELNESMDAWVNEEGLLLGLPMNRVIAHRIPVAGPIVIMAHDEDGESVGLSPGEAQHWLENAEDWPVVKVVS